MTGERWRGQAGARAALIGLALGVLALGWLAALGAGRWPVGVVVAVDLLLVAVCARHLRAAGAEPGDDAGAGPQPPYDSLTGLPGRRTLTAVLERTLPVADADQEPAGLVLLDVTGLADVNDTLGRRVGDLLLAEMAARLTAAVRDTDTVARSGGDEFAVLLPQVGSAPAALETARRLRDAVRGPADLDGFQVQLSVTAGAAVYPVHATTATELLHRAEAALRAAGQSRDGVVAYGERSRPEVPSRPGRPALDAARRSGRAR
ncbi:GGDEF domain-containing protein [Actinoplanes teichomyceticus]|uniref:Diguanylate cyclase (GGDEF)-like protein n=1 Tax=Actinoplanes teichomyceticus TaxID=1867 RepID=A0A561WAZ0_ACTTI|nr:GGDEF domain-containing protein [Actinoplanes teichomyceticus]TWG21036.1 diguanylate cyclase (GGDEF)-like protein [Actinoplanes teichomyceticus]GIF14856.1 hypothetical protein Ate01nite_48880 [Actinoplanes teichomyceticus]